MMEFCNFHIPSPLILSRATPRTDPGFFPGVYTQIPLAERRGGGAVCERAWERRLAAAAEALEAGEAGAAGERC
jgi:hypothetical protein